MPQTRNCFSRTPTDWLSFPPGEPDIRTDVVLLVPRRGIFGLRLSFLNACIYFAMNGLVILRKARIALLRLLSLACLAWAILFAIFLHHEWPYSSPLQKIIVVSLLSLYVFTAILLYLMAVVQYCPCWDVVRMFAVLVVHIGSSVFFSHNKPSFPCHGFGTETSCKEFIFTIFVGCWVFSVTFLCFAIALVVMAFIPQPEVPLPGTEEDGLPSNPDCFRASSPMTDEQQTFLLSSIELPESLPPDHNTCPANSTHRVIIPWPMESSQGTEDDDPPSNPDWFKVGGPTADGRQTFLSSRRTGQVTHDNELREVSPDRSASPLNSIYSALEPPHFWQNFENRNSRRSNESGSHGGTLSMRNTPGGGSSTDSGSLRVGPFSHYSFRDSSTPPVSIYAHSPLGVGGETINRPRIGQIGLLPSPNHSTVLYRQSLTVTPPLS